MTIQKSPTELGTQKVGKLLLQYALPAIIAMTASSLYNMVDSIFIGHGVGTMAISGLALTFPLMNLAAAFGSLVGVGAATLASVKLGQKDYTTARQVLGNVVVLNIIIGILFTIVALIFLNPILYFFGASDQTRPYAYDYMYIILLGNVVTHLYFGLNAILRVSGYPKKAMYATIFTVVINTILDPIFIYWFGWGIQGAAIATVLGQLLALLWITKQFANPNEVIHFTRGIFHLKKRIVIDSLSIGMSPFLMNLAATFVVLLINQGLLQHGGDIAIGAYGIVNRFAFMFVMIVMGINQGMQPIAGYNFGALQYDRVTRVLKLSIYVATCILTVGFVVGMLFPDTAAGIFTSDQKLIDLTAEGMRIVMVTYPIIGFQMVTANFFQSIGMAGKAIFLSLTRQLLFLIPCLLILPHYYGTIGVWASMPAADLAASITTAVMLWWQFRQFKRGKVVNRL
ncbi:MAG: MATE family efflux transporter [Prevotellaceae bacterium]|jgi:putative MATE family efflux protein|nr:MATE family efflux transporter [Prevotellaceae bacterium]